MSEHYLEIRERPVHLGRSPGSWASMLCLFPTQWHSKVTRSFLSLRVTSNLGGDGGKDAVSCRLPLASLWALASLNPDHTLQWRSPTLWRRPVAPPTVSGSAVKDGDPSGPQRACPPPRDPRFYAQGLSPVSDVTSIAWNATG